MLCSQCAMTPAKVELECRGKQWSVCPECAHRLLRQNIGFRLIAVDQALVDDVMDQIANERNGFMESAIRHGFLV